MASRVVLITGAGGYWGTRVAMRLLEEPELHIIGQDVEAQHRLPNGLDFIRADLRNPLLTELLQEEHVDTVCHLEFVHHAHPTTSASAANVQGTQNLLDACARAGVRKVVIKSSIAVYGALPDNAAFLSEDESLRGSRRYGYVRDLIEIENLCTGFRRQHRETTLTTLRLASVVGPTADTPMTRFLKNRLAPVLLGFDPLLQLLHEDDAIEGLTHAVMQDSHGVFNVAAEAVLPLSKILALSGTLHPPIGHSLVYWGLGALLARGLDMERYVPIHPDYLRYSWVSDLTRMRHDLGFEPRCTAEEALREFAARHNQPMDTTALASDEKRLRATLERRRRSRER